MKYLKDEKLTSKLLSLMQRISLFGVYSLVADVCALSPHFEMIGRQRKQTAIHCALLNSHESRKSKANFTNRLFVRSRPHADVEDDGRCRRLLLTLIVAVVQHMRPNERLDRAALLQRQHRQQHMRTRLRVLRNSR